MTQASNNTKTMKFKSGKNIFKKDGANKRKDVKIGARILGKEELKRRLDNYEDIFVQIADIREVAEEFNKTMRNKDNGNRRYNLLKEREFNKHYNNIFSILGDRGFGKTSVLMTLKYMLMTGEFDNKNKIEHSENCNVNTKDIFLPVIVPEDMENTSDVLGWLIGYLGNIVDEVEKQVKLHAARLSQDNDLDKYFDTCKKFKDNTFQNRFVNLQIAYAKRTKEYNDIIKDNYTGINEYVEGKSQALTSDQNLMTKFQEFWDELLFVKRKINNINIEPLLFVFFDDVDISAQRCFEVLNTAMRYLSYPNIVVFMCGDYKMFSETLTIDILKRDGLIGRIMNESYLMSSEKSALELRKQIARDYLIKMMPPTYRYILPVYNEKMKSKFTYTTEEDNETNDDDHKHYSLYQLLEENFVKDDNSNFMIIHSLSKSTTKSVADEDDNDVNGDTKIQYSTNNKANEENIIYTFFKIFPDNPRGLMNVYYYLYSKTKDNEKQNHRKERNLDWTGFELKQFLNIMVDSSALLSSYKEQIYQIIEIKDQLDDSFIGYDYLLDYFETSICKLNDDRWNKQSIIEDYLTIYILSYFFECIIHNILPNGWNKVHGKQVLYSILKRYQDKFILFPQINTSNDSVQKLLKFYHLISEGMNMKYTYLLNDEDKNYYTKKYFQQLLKLNETKEAFVEFMDKIRADDVDWVRHKIDIVMKYAGEEQTVIKDKLDEFYKILDSQVEINK